jgi:hypothetical protein
VIRPVRTLTQPLLTFAHLAFCAAAILARPSALIRLRIGLDVAAGLELRDRPRLAGAVVSPFNRAFARSRRAISASIVWIISVVSMLEIIVGTIRRPPRKGDL